MGGLNRSKCPDGRLEKSAVETPPDEPRRVVLHASVTRNFTTLILKNIPNNYTRKMLLELLDGAFRGSYDFVYLPVDLKRRSCLGYAFVNLVNHAEAIRFKAHFEGFCSWACRSQKAATVEWTPAHCQGQQHHVDRLRNKNLMCRRYPDAYKPLIFECGEPVPFPGPTKGKFLASNDVGIACSPSICSKHARVPVSMAETTVLCVASAL